MPEKFLYARGKCTKHEKNLKKEKEKEKEKERENKQ